MKLREADFYCGAILSALIGRKYKLVLMNNEDKRMIYRVTTDKEEDFVLYMKYSINGRKNKKESVSWSVAFCDSDRAYWLANLVNDKKTKLAILLRQNDLKQSEIAILEHDEICQLVFPAGKDKKSLTIRREKNGRVYQLFTDGKRVNALNIPTNCAEQFN